MHPSISKKTVAALATVDELLSGYKELTFETKQARVGIVFASGKTELIDRAETFEIQRFGKLVSDSSPETIRFSLKN